MAAWAYLVKRTFDRYIKRPPSTPPSSAGLIPTFIPLVLITLYNLNVIFTFIQRQWSESHLPFSSRHSLQHQPSLL
ncbi:hypothetical protein CPB83DRAFT_854164 [Crepidotus variabilis]|uniref:Uncharacterized protein n=1 Tax=Crepidotus variabilis TaxID=179855 RepID=A0A9P6JPP1_9AGAR|nr:hypothetical protein CPB83DRAFT_854164 [Crepidotus variabilis]